MRIIRFAHERQISYGVLEGDRVLPLEGEPWDERGPFGNDWPLSQVTLLAPCTPSKIVAVGLNYRDHAEEFSLPLPPEPMLFIKPSTAVIGPEEYIVYPPSSRQVDYEAELAVVIGKLCRQVAPQAAEDFILGYTCINDVTARDLQRKDGQFTRSKGFDSFAPLGPWIESALDPSDLQVEAYVNGDRRQSSSTRNLIFGVKELVSFISQVMTLLPGDVIATGTPSGVGLLTPGDEVEIRISGIGGLKNRIK